MTTHRMDHTASYPGEHLFVCPTCERRLVFKTAAGGEMIVIDEGDPTVMHSGSTAGMSMTATIDPGE